MEKASTRRGVEVGGSFSSTDFHPDRTELDGDEAELKFACGRAAQFLSDLIGARRKEVALAYWPMPTDAERKWSSERLEAYVKSQLANLTRLLLQHHDRPPTVRFLFVVAKVLGPEAGVRIAHFFDDEFGTERGSVKLNPKRVQDDLAVVKNQLAQIVGALGSVTSTVERLDRDVKASR